MLVPTDSVKSFFVFLETVGAVFAVITWTTSFVTSSLRLSPPKVDGADVAAIMAQGRVQAIGPPTEIAAMVSGSYLGGAA